MEKVRPFFPVDPVNDKNVVSALVGSYEPNWWGLSDRYIWQERPQAGLIDENYNPKPVYDRLRQLIKSEWMTNTSGNLNEDGSFSFRGFHGRYKIILKTSDNQVHTFSIHLSKKEKNEWRFIL